MFGSQLNWSFRTLIDNIDFRSGLPVLELTSPFAIFAANIVEKDFTIFVSDLAVNRVLEDRQIFNITRKIVGRLRQGVGTITVVSKKTVRERNGQVVTATITVKANTFGCDNVPGDRRKLSNFKEMFKIFLLLIFAFCALFNGCLQNNHSSAPTYNTSSLFITITLGKAPGCVEIADLNGDTIPDLVVTNEGDSSVTVLLGKGNLRFEEASGSPFPAGHGVNDVAIADFNTDGNLDLAFANHERKYLTVLLGNGEGGFTNAPNSPVPVEVIPHTHGIATGDFNDDGRPDLVTDSWGDNQVEVVFCDPTNGFKVPGTFFKVGNHPYQRVRVADINNDGKSDIVTTNLDGDNATILLGTGRGDFHEASGSPVACGNSPFGLAIGDVNADGKKDLAVINSPASTADRIGINGLTVLLGDGTGNFSMLKGCPYSAGKIPNRVAIGDLNGDGVNDIVTSDNGANNIYVFLTNTMGTALSALPIRVGNHPKGVAIADFNGDGKGEIVVCNNLDNNILIVPGR